MRLMANAEYWRDREAKQRETYIRTEDEELAEINRIYNEMYRWAEREINAFYGKYASAEGIDITEAKKRVSKLDIEEYERLAKQYVKDKDFSDRANAEMRLYNATMKINRLELLKAMIGLKLVDGINDIDKHWEKIATDRATQEIIRQSGILGKTLTETETVKTAKQIVNADFYNANFSERIWSHMDNLRSELAIELQKGFIAGIGSRQMATNLRKQFDVSVRDAHRLARTELRRIQTDVAKDNYERNGFDEYEFMAVNSRACPICRELDGQIFKVKDMKPGENAPPIHPNCHCTTAPHMNDDEYNAWLNYLEQGGTTAQWDQMTDADRQSWYDRLVDNISASEPSTRPSLDDYREIDLDEFKKLKGKITKEERQVIYGKSRADGYINSSNARVNINAPMREGKSLEPTYRKIADTLQVVIDRNRIPTNMKMVRYVDPDALEGMFGIKIHNASLKETLEESYEKAVKALNDRTTDTYTEKGFLSASAVKDNNVMTHRGVQINMYVDEGTPAYISTNNKESEVIFGSGTKVELLDIRYDRNVVPWMYIVDVKVSK